MSERTRFYYPSDTAPQKGPHCGFETDSNFDRKYYSSTCLLSPDHDGEHNFSANWNAHIEVEQIYYGGLELSLRSWHDSRGLRIRTKEEAEKILAFLRETFDDLLSEPPPRQDMTS